MKDRTGWHKYRRKLPEPAVDAREATLTIETLTNAGDGLGRLEQLAIFVPGTLPGDRVRVRIRKRRKNHATAELLEILSPGEHRIEPRCRFFQQCGGCDWQHVPYEQQLAAKAQQLAETLRRIGQLQVPPIDPVQPSPRHYEYRNRIQGYLHGGRFHFHRRGSEQHLAVDRCEIAEPAINRFLAENDHSMSVQGKVEIAVDHGSVSVLPINDRRSTELGFRQVNSAVSALLDEQLLARVGEIACDRVIDLYCGRGRWTNRLAAERSEGSIVGVDSSAENIAFAREQAARQHLSNVRFLQAPVERSLGKLAMQDSVCIVDPPRAGLDPRVVEALGTHGCRRLIYVSCHPATLARDLGRLVGPIYRIAQITPLDMFPQTAHLETLVVLDRRDRD